MRVVHSVHSVGHFAPALCRTKSNRMDFMQLVVATELSCMTFHTSKTVAGTCTRKMYPSLCGTII